VKLCVIFSPLFPGTLSLFRSSTLELVYSPQIPAPPPVTVILSPRCLRAKDLNESTFRDYDAHEVLRASSSFASLSTNRMRSE
jgi:hypothetical protein